MSTPAEKLAAIFALEEVEANVFKGESQDLRLPQLFGGQVLGQAAMAMTRTVLADKNCIPCTGTSYVQGARTRP